MHREYEKKMNDHSDQIHRAHSMAMDVLDRKYRKQMTEVIAACDKGDLAEAQKQFEVKLADAREAPKK
jgi:hypothetical protein